MFNSKFVFKGYAPLPKFSGIRVMMMPVIIGDLNSVPDMLGGYADTLNNLFGHSTKHTGDVGYITIDEKAVRGGVTHRRAGLHVDGVFQGSAGKWGGGGKWGSVGNGMLTVANIIGCRAWNQSFEGFPGYEGECNHLSDQCGEATEFVPNGVYWVDGLCVHESMAMAADVERQFLRLSMPSDGPWFEGYTKNPLGVKPSGSILPRRSFMDM